MMSLLFLSFLVGGADAGELKISASVPVVISVDGRPQTFRPGSLTVVQRNLSEGAHLVTVRTLTGRLAAEMTVEVGLEEEVRLSYRKKTLTEVGRGQAKDRLTLAEATAMGVESAQASAAAMSAAADMLDSATQLSESLSGDPTPPPSQTTVVVAAPAVPATAPVAVAAPPVAGFGSLEVAELNPLNGAVWVDGLAAPYAAGTSAFVMPGLSAGQHHVRIEQNGRPYYDAPLEIRVNQNTRCVLVYEGMTWSPSCHFTAAAHTSVNQTLGTISVSSAAPVAPAAPAGPVAMNSRDFSALRSAVEDESFSSDQMDMIRTSAAHNHFTVAQVGQLMDLLSASSDKVDVVLALASRVVDPGNAAQLAGHVSFSSDKDAVMAAFR